MPGSEDYRWLGFNSYPGKVFSMVNFYMVLYYNMVYGIILQYDEFQQSVAIPEGRRMTLMISCYLFQLNGSVIRNKGSGYHDFWRPFATKIGLSSVC